MGLFSKPRLVGIDIGTRTLKGIVLKRAQGKVWLESYFFQDLAENNELFPLESPMPQALNAAIEVNKLKGAEVAASLEDKDILIHDIVLPQMPDEDFDLAIKNEIEEQFGISASETNYDHVLIGPAEDAAKAFSYKIYCAKKSAIEKTSSLLEAAQTKPIAIESSILAQVSTLAFNDYLSPDKYCVLIDLGESHITVSLIKGTKVASTNVFSVGFGSINQQLFESYGLAYENADQLKLSYNMQSAEEDADDIHKQIDEILSDLLYKVQRLVASYRIATKTKAVEKIYVTGGGSRLNHLTTALETYCDIPAEIINPFKNIEIYSPSGPRDDKIATLTPYMTTAVGLALRGVL